MVAPTGMAAAGIEPALEHAGPASQPFAGGCTTHLRWSDLWRG